MPKGDDNPAILKDFQQRLAHYVEFQRGVEKSTPAQKQTNEPIQIEIATQLLATKIRNLRKTRSRATSSRRRSRRVQAAHQSRDEGRRRETRQAIPRTMVKPGKSVKGQRHLPADERCHDASTSCRRFRQLPEDVEFRIVAKRWCSATWRPTSSSTSSRTRFNRTKGIGHAPLTDVVLLLLGLTVRCRRPGPPPADERGLA